MRTEVLEVECFRIYDAMRRPGRGVIDPITVTLRDVGGGGQITVECYGEAWSHWFGAIGSKTLREFIAQTDPGYLAGKLVTSTRKVLKREEDYVEDIANAVIQILQGGAS